MVRAELHVANSSASSAAEEVEVAAEGVTAIRPHRHLHLPPFASQSKRPRLSDVAVGAKVMSSSRAPKTERFPTVLDDERDEDGDGFMRSSALILQSIRDQAEALISSKEGSAQQQQKMLLDAIKYQLGVNSVGNLREAHELDMKEDSQRATLAGFSTIQTYLESFYGDGPPPVQARSLMYDTSDTLPAAAEAVIVFDAPQQQRDARGGNGVPARGDDGPATDPRPRITARKNDDLTLSMPAFKAKEVERRIKGLVTQDVVVGASGRADEAAGNTEGRSQRGGAASSGGAVADPLKAVAAAAARAAKAARSKGAPLGGPYEGDWQFIRCSTGDWSQQYSHEYLKAAAREGKLGLLFGKTKIYRKSDNMWLPLRYGTDQRLGCCAAPCASQSASLSICTCMCACVGCVHCCPLTLT